MRKVRFSPRDTREHLGTASQLALAVEDSPANAGDVRDVGSIPGSGRSPGGGHGNPLQCSCLENPMDRGALEAMVHRVTQSQTRLKGLSAHKSLSKCVELSPIKEYILLFF